MEPSWTHKIYDLELVFPIPIVSMYDILTKCIHGTGIFTDIWLICFMVNVY